MAGEMRLLSGLPVFDARYQKPAFRAAFLIYLAVLVFGSIPGARTEIGNFASGLVLHLLTYGLITFLLFIGSKGGASAKMVKSLLIVAAMGAVDECIQSLLPYRTASFTDWLVDINAAMFTAFFLRAASPKARTAVPPRSPTT